MHELLVSITSRVPLLNGTPKELPSRGTLIDLSPPPPRGGMRGNLTSVANGTVIPYRLLGGIPLTLLPATTGRREVCTVIYTDLMSLALNV